jgi:hypothetical protein
MQVCRQDCALGIACATWHLTQVGAISPLMGGSAYNSSLRYKRSAGLATPSGPRFSTCVSIMVVLTSLWPISS